MINCRIWQNYGLTRALTWSCFVRSGSISQNTIVLWHYPVSRRCWSRAVVSSCHSDTDRAARADRFFRYRSMPRLRLPKTASCNFCDGLRLTQFKRETRRWEFTGLGWPWRTSANDAGLSASLRPKSCRFLPVSSGPSRLFALDRFLVSFESFGHFLVEHEHRPRMT